MVWSSPSKMYVREWVDTDGPRQIFGVCSSSMSAIAECTKLRYLQSRAWCISEQIDSEHRQKGFLGATR